MVLKNIGSQFRRSQPTDTFTINKLQVADLGDALRLGWEDFKAVPSHAVMLAVIYPILGIVLARTVHGLAILPLLFPLAAGFALLGPFAALGLYELSRLREGGEEPSASDALRVFKSPSIGSILALGFLLALLLIYVVNKQSFGWTIQFHWPIAVLVGALSVVYAATILAALYPARIATKLVPIEVIHEE